MKGFVQRMRESEPIVLGKFTKEDFDGLIESLKVSQENDKKHRESRLKDMEENRKHLFKRAKELNKEIPFELAYYAYLNYGPTYVGSEFMEKYKEWL